MGSDSTYNERRIREFIEVWDSHDSEAILQFYADSYLEGGGKERIQTIHDTWFDAFPDMTNEIKELAVAGNWVLARLRVRGTHTGTFEGIPPTGNEIDISDHFAARLEDGKIAEYHANFDLFELCQQLGLPSPYSNGREAENKGIVQGYFEAVNERDQSRFRGTLATDFTYGEIDSGEDMVEFTWNWVTAFDPRWSPQAMHVDGDVVTTRSKITGTHKGERFGLEPTNESFEVSAIAMGRIETGAINEWWVEWDVMDFLEQIGVRSSHVDVEALPMLIP